MLRNPHRIPVREILAAPRAEGPYADGARARAGEFTLEQRRGIDRVRIAWGDLPLFQDPPAKRGRKPRDVVAMS